MAFYARRPSFRAQAGQTICFLPNHATNLPSLNNMATDFNPVDGLTTLPSSPGGQCSSNTHLQGFGLILKRLRMAL